LDKVSITISQNPKDAQIKASSQWVVPIIFTLLGSIAFIAALLNKIRMAPLKKKSPV